MISPWDMVESNLRSEFSTAKIQLTMKFSRVYNLMLHISLHIAKKIHYTLWIPIQQIVLLNENWYLYTTYLHKFTSWNCPLCASSIPNILALRGYSNAHTHTHTWVKPFLYDNNGLQVSGLIRIKVKIQGFSKGVVVVENVLDSLLVFLLGIFSCLKKTPFLRIVRQHRRTCHLLKSDEK